MLRSASRSSSHALFCRRIARRWSSMLASEERRVGWRWSSGSAAGRGGVAWAVVVGERGRGNLLVDGVAPVEGCRVLPLPPPREAHERLHG